MSESLNHRQLVIHLREFIMDTHGGNTAVSLVADQDNKIGEPRPPEINGNIPDVYAKVLSSGLEIIGEAKTISDFETHRSISQIGNFLDYLMPRRNALFYLCVPWFHEIYAENVIRDLLTIRSIPLNQFQLVPHY